MAIKIKNLQEIAEDYEIKKFLYSDLRLDFAKESQYSEEIRRRVESNDVAVDYDEGAIKNSLKNLFNTKPGQRFLFPNYGLDLYQFVFEPISENVAQRIGEIIVDAVTTYEPRVKVQNCYIKCLVDDNEYDITLIVEIPVFNTTASINSKLDIRNQSFIFIETSKNR